MSDEKGKDVVPPSLRDALAAFDSVKGDALTRARVTNLPEVLPAVDFEDDDEDDEDDEEDEEEEEDEEGAEDEGAEEEGPFEDEQIETLSKGLRKLAKRVGKAEGIVELRALLAQSLRDVAEINLLMLAYAEPSEDASSSATASVDFIRVQRAVMTATSLFQFVGNSPDVGPAWQKMLQSLPEQLRVGLERGRLAAIQQLEAAYQDIESRTGVGFEAVARADGVDPAVIAQAEQEARKRPGAGG